LFDYFTLELELRRDDDKLWLMVSHEDPRTQVEAMRLHRPVSFDLEQLLSEQWGPEAYGAALSGQLFADEQVQARFVEVQGLAESAGFCLRVVIRVDPSAADLESLRWELLRHPVTGDLLATSERVLLSRFMFARDRRLVRLRPRAKLRALIAVAAPPAVALERLKLAAIDVDGELARARTALVGVQLRELGAAGTPCTIAALLDALRDGVDILYFVGHGTSGKGKPALVFPGELNDVDFIEGERFAQAIRGLARPPRLAVLASCESAGDGEQVIGPWTVQATLAGRLADAGVAAVVAMQGLISIATVERLMPSFFARLLEDGQIDRALAVARARVKARHDAWMPALFSRLVDGRLWPEEVRSTEIIDFSTERERHVHFFGREDIFAEIDAQLAARPSGWVVITAGPGMGKSALLDRWLTRREEQGLRTAYHFIRRGHQNWADPAAIRANLAAQIEAMFPELVDARADPRDRLEKLLAKVRGTERLVLLVDGLDEAMRVGKENPVPQIFPTEVPEGVFVLVASRPRYPFLNWFKQRTGALHEIDLDARSKSNGEAVSGYWKALAPRMDPPLGAELRATAIANAQGNLLHAVKLHERWTKPGADRSVEDVPKGLAGTLQGLWDGIGELPKAQKQLARDGLSLVCAARESLPLHVIEELLEWDEGDGKDEFLPLAREILLEECWDDVPSYRPFHESMRELVARELPRAAKRDAGRLAKFAAWPLEGDSFQHRYALRHRVVHQVEAEQLDAAEATCLDVGYLTAKACEAGIVDVERDVRLVAGAQPAKSRLSTLERVLGVCSHWARRYPEALATLLHDRVLTHFPDLQHALAWPAQYPSGFPRLRHPLQRRGLSGLLRTLQGHQESVRTVAVLHDGRLVSASSDTTLRIWDVDSGTSLALQGHRGSVLAVNLLPDGRLVSASSDTTLRIWDVGDGTSLATLHGHHGSVNDVTVLPDGRIVSASDDNTLRVWDIDSGTSLATLHGHHGSVLAVTLLPNGRIVSASYDHTLRIWDVDSGTDLAIILGDAAFTSIAAPREGLLVGGDANGNIWFIDLDEARTCRVEAIRR
jgi:hypothetical protein